MSIFLSRYINKIDKKGRVSVPADYRSCFAQEKFNCIVAYPSFKNNCIEVCTMSRLEEFSHLIQKLDPYSEERDAFETVVLGESRQLQFDKEGRVNLPEYLTMPVEISDQACFVGKGLVFEIWNPKIFDNHLKSARKIAQKNKLMLRNNTNIAVSN